MKNEKATITKAEIATIARGACNDPFAVLGPHVRTNGRQHAVVVRAFLPRAERVQVIPTVAGLIPQVMNRLHPDGVFEAQFPRCRSLFPYRFEVTQPDGSTIMGEDPYRFSSTLSDYDLHLLCEGTHYRAYEKLGAHATALEGASGVVFTVWAPNARRVSVVGDFNHWDGRVHPMRFHPGSGIWELFIPGLTVGVRYKYEIVSQQGELLALKADPYSFAFELDTPRTASVVSDLTYHWGDAEWMAQRAARNAPDAPISIYEVHLGSWARAPKAGNRRLTYRELAHALAPYLVGLRYTHVQLLPVTEHPFYGSWGYQPLGYFAPTRRYGTPQDFMYFVDYLHQHGVGVILDWVPAHFPRDPHGLVYFDGTHLYEHADPRQREHQDWGTLVFNYGRTEVANFLLNSALFWLDRYHLDGLRVDAVASMLYLDYSRQPGDWIPNIHGGNENLEAIAFLKRFNEAVRQHSPDVMTIAEESTAWPLVSRPTSAGGLGFTFKWNMGWMHDVLEYMGKDPVHRQYHHRNLTFGLLYAWSENFILPLSHDEVVHGKRSLRYKMPGDDWQGFANLRLLYAFMYGYPGKKLLFMGNDFGQTAEWNHEQSLDWHLLQEGPYHRGVQRLVQDLNHLYQTRSALHQLDGDPLGFQWITCDDAEQSVVAFLRRAKNPDDCFLVVCNFTPVPRYDYRIGAPSAGYWQEVINTDGEMYGGGNLGNNGGVWTDAVAAHEHPQSLLLTLPPLAALYLQRR
jgi:1,4-alpha-glucan branching enzyme